MTEVNIPLLRKLVEWAESDYAAHELAEYSGSTDAKRSWLQSYWAYGATTDQEVRHDGVTYRVVESNVDCGTSFCIAGNACHWQGDTFLTSVIAGYDPVRDHAYMLINAETGEVQEIRNRAAALLGINANEAVGPGGLFFSANRIEDIRRIAEELAGEKL